jgi:hypothetical protein
VSFDRLFSIGGAIVTVALVTTIVAHRNSAAVINSIGQAFAGSIRAAMGGAR